MSMTDCQRIVSYCEANGSITSLEAFQKLGCTRLSGRIWDLKHRGYLVDEVWEESIDRYGDRTRYKRYFVKREETTA